MKSLTRSAKVAENGQVPHSEQKGGHQPLLIAVVGVIVSLALTWFMVVAPAITDLYRSSGATGGSGALSMINVVNAQMITRTDTLARWPALTSALQAQDPAAIAQAQQQIPLADGLIGARLNLRAQAQADQQGLAPINFAVLDMIGRAERDAPPSPEAYKVNGRWVIYSVRAVRASPQTPVLGTLVLAFDAQALSQTTALSSPEIGQLRLLQSVMGSPPQLLSVQGTKPGSAFHTYSTDNANWSVEFEPGPAYAPRYPISSLSLLILAAAIAIGCAVLAIKLTRRQLHRQVEDDARQLQQLLQELSGGKAVKAFGLGLAPLNRLAQSLAHYSLRTGNPPAAMANHASELSDAPAKEWTNPIFQNTDILEIDVLEESQEGPGTLVDTPIDTPVDTPPSLPHSIFRAYDIRGIVGETLTVDTAYWVGRAVGAQSLSMGEPCVNVGRDGRLSGPELVQPLIQGLMDAGCQVSDLGLVPTPALYYATYVLTGRSGVMLTGSHNPPRYNGFKVMIAGDTLANEQILALHQRLVRNDLSHGQGSVEKVDILERYFAQIKEDIVLTRRLKVVVDCGNGAGGVIAPRLIEALGCDVVPLFCEVDGHFPNHHPDPGKAQNLQALIAKVRETGADIGLAFDGDADRVGVVTHAGTIIQADRLLMLFARDVLARNPGADVIYDVKCTRRLSPLIKEFGGRPVMWKTGHSLMKKEMVRTGALLAGELSGHIFFKERWFGFDDGIYAAARLLEILSQNNLSAEALFAAFPNDICTPELNIPVTEDNKFSIIDALHNDASWGDAKLTDIDGVRVDYPRGWGLVRASNTTPVLVLRFEADDAEELERIQSVFRTQLLSVAPHLQLPF